MLALFFLLAADTVVVPATVATPLADACERDDLAAARALLEAGHPVDERQPDGMTALHWAVRHERDDLAARLLAAGADPQATTEYSITPLAIACENGDGALVRRLLEAGADPLDRIPTRQTMLMVAARTGSPEVVRQLLAAGVPVDARESRDQTALMWAAAEGNVAAVRLLLEAGADVSLKSTNGFTALLFAARHGRRDVAAALLEGGADVGGIIRPKETWGRNPRDRMSPLLFAVESGHFALALDLVAAGADPDDQRSGYTALHALTWVRRADRGDGVTGDPEPRGSGEVSSLEFVRRLVAAGADVNTQLTRGKPAKATLTKKGATAFLMAAETADLPLLKTLLECGADPTIANADNCTALLAAAGIGVRSLVDEDPGTEPEVVATVEWLLSLGLDINHRDGNGETVMHAAAYRNYPGEVVRLAELGADPAVWNRPNAHGWTPRDIARGKRPGAFKPSPPTIAAIERLLDDAGMQNGELREATDD